MNCYTREQIEETMGSKGYKYFTGGDYDVNIIGVRNSDTQNKVEQVKVLHRLINGLQVARS